MVHVSRPKNDGPVLVTPRRNAFAVMAQGPPVHYLEVSPGLSVDPTVSEGLPLCGEGEILHLDDQIKDRLRLICQTIKLGFTSDKSKALLETNLNKLSNVLCFIHGHWTKLFRAAHTSRRHGPGGSFPFA